MCYVPMTQYKRARSHLEIKCQQLVIYTVSMKYICMSLSFFGRLAETLDSLSKVKVTVRCQSMVIPSKFVVIFLALLRAEGKLL